MHTEPGNVTIKENSSPSTRLVQSRFE